MFKNPNLSAGLMLAVVYSVFSLIGCVIITPMDAVSHKSPINGYWLVNCVLGLILYGQVIYLRARERTSPPAVFVFIAIEFLCLAAAVFWMMFLTIGFSGHLFITACTVMVNLVGALFALDSTGWRFQRLAERSFLLGMISPPALLFTLRDWITDWLHDLPTGVGNLVVFGGVTALALLIACVAFLCGWVRQRKQQSRTSDQDK